MAPKFIITVDTETFQIGGRVPPFDTHHYADLPSGSFGVQRIMDVCDQYGAKATFFVDVYMHRHYGEAPVAELCQRLDRGGHDVQLHAHTSWLPDSQSGLICEYSLNRQIDILAEGRDLIRKWTGKAPLGFRAGAYGANLNTIRALNETGFTVDSSYFPLHSNCELSRQLGDRCLNQPFSVDGILEIPVTTYWLWKTRSRQKNSKIDVNACSWWELENVVRKMAHSPVIYPILFLHSFSFVRSDRKGSNLVPQIKPLERFEALLKMIRSELGGEFTTVGEIASQLVPESLPALDYMATVPLSHLVPRVLARMFE